MKQRARRGADEPAAETATRSDSRHRRAHRGPGSDHGLREPPRAAAAVIMTTPASRRPCSMVSAPLPRTSPRALHARGGLGRAAGPRAPGRPGTAGPCTLDPPGAPALPRQRQPRRRPWPRATGTWGSRARRPGPGAASAPSIRRSRPRVSEGAGATSVPRSVPSHAALGPSPSCPGRARGAPDGYSRRRRPGALSSCGSQLPGEVKARFPRGALLNPGGQVSGKPRFPPSARLGVSDWGCTLRVLPGTTSSCWPWERPVWGFYFLLFRGSLVATGLNGQNSKL